MKSHNHPTSSLNLLSFSEIDSRSKLLCNANNHLLISEFIKNKVNAYVGYVLYNFVFDKLTRINHMCNLIKLSQDKLDKVHGIFIKQIIQVRYASGYYKQKEFKRTSINSYDLDYDSFELAMHKSIPLLEKHDEFISAALGIKEKKEHILLQVKQIKVVINEYTGKNKEGIINTFNQNIEELIKSLNKKNLFEVVAEAQTKMNEFLENMQAEENKYYNDLLFFKSHRQANSSLQHKINSAKILLGEIKLTENTQENAKLPIRRGI